ncbi:MAG: ABC transporter ATP-binding protein [Actinobacteria bacterium RBG_19FT_COMBO_70_19]|nr:MAG: ABC transporter ATP-binding protein [Actinobacteria bacterium RBG_19FT_COMBO_70_19]
MATITFDAVTKVYPDGTEAVRNLDLQIGDGEFMVFVGPSGCGKSTALKMVAGLEGISEGTITIGDRVVNELPPKDRDVAMVFQDYALYPHMSVYDNMAFSLKIRKFTKSDIRGRVQDAAVILGIDDLLDRRPKALSGGQRQRVAMGRAIVREPQAFLMDEPLSNLDAKLRVQMRAEIRRIQTDLGVTTIFVTHDQTEAMTMGDRVAVIKKGHLQQVDTPQVLYEQPANLFVGGFIGSPAMNMVEARIDRDDGRLGVRFGSTRLELDPAVIARRPDLETFEGRRLVLGIRPEGIQHERYAGLDPKGRQLRAKIDLLESLGSEVLAHFAVDAPPVLTEDTRELARDREETDRLEGLVAERVSTFVAKIDPRAQVRLGDTVDLVVDTSRLHLFDPEDGSRIE